MLISVKFDCACNVKLLDSLETEAINPVLFVHFTTPLGLVTNVFLADVAMAVERFSRTPKFDISVKELLILLSVKL